MGRILFIFYALFGIPLCLALLSEVGGLLSHFVDTVVGGTMKAAKGRQLNPRKTLATLLLVFSAIFVGGLVLFILFPALIFHSIEGWTYADAIYYCCVTLTTVGFGDFVAGQQRVSGTMHLLNFYRICASLWIIIGLAWVSLLITKIQKLFEQTGPFLRTTVK